MARGSTSHLPKNIYWVYTSYNVQYAPGVNRLIEDFQGPYASRPTLVLKNAREGARLVTYTLDENGNYFNSN